MIDKENNSSQEHTSADRIELTKRIDELEQLLAKKKAEASVKTTTRMKVGTDGIPVLVDVIDPEHPDDADLPAENTLQNNVAIEEIINKVDKEISQDLDELIGMLKNSIIDEVKIRLLEELAGSKKEPDK